MLKALVAVDGSPYSDRAVRHAMKLVKHRAPYEIHLLNVQPALGGDVSAFVGSGAVKDFHREEGEKALASARAILDQARISYTMHIGVGAVGETIAEFARRLGVDEILMGTHGRGALAGLLLGSAATQVIQLAELPVTLVK
ncbi:MAG: universal stress protein [Pseudomonadota bacterium]